MIKLKLIIPQRFGDHRGYFGETYSRRRYEELGINSEFVQDNHSLSHASWNVARLAFSGAPRRAR